MVPDLSTALNGRGISGEFDLPSGRFAGLPIENSDMPDDAGQVTTGPSANRFSDPGFTRLVFNFNKLDLDQFVFFQSGVHRSEDLVGQSVFTNENQSSQRMG